MPVKGILVAALVYTLSPPSWKPILEHIDSKYEEYLIAEGHINR